jgi:hypothetical protein
MRAYHFGEAIIAFCLAILLQLFVIPTAISPRSFAQAPPPAPTATVPSAVVGNVKYCPKTIQHDTAIVGCKLVDASPADQQLTKDAMVELNKLLVSPQFKAAVLAANFDPAQMKKCANQNSCGPRLTNQQVYNMILANSPQKLDVTYYVHGVFSEGNQGFDLSGVNTAFVNDKKVNGDKGYLASLMLHEWMHVLGFRHDSTHTWCESVPYKMNAIYAQVSQNFPELNLAKSDGGCTDK